MSEGQYEQAITSLNKALNLRPKELSYFLQRAEAFLQLCDFQSAILNYKRVCVLEPDNFQHYSRLAFIYYMQGQCLFDQKLFPEALEAFSRAAEMRPEVVGYHTRRYRVVDLFFCVDKLRMIVYQNCKIVLKYRGLLKAICKIS